MKKLLLFIIASLFIAELSAQYQVIVNSSNTVNSISKNDASKYFMKKTTKWPDGETVKPVDLKGNSSVRESFTSAVLGKSVSAIKSYWQQFVFSGKGTPPLEKGSDAEVISFVKNNPGAIGYVSSSADVSGVKVITISE